MKKKLSVFIMILCLLLCTTSCGSNSEAAKYQVYYLDMDETSITGVDYELQAGESNPTEMVDELLMAMKEAPEVTGLRATLPDNVEVLDHSENGYLVTIDFNSAYYEMDKTEEVLVRAAVVKTISQVKAYSYVSFTVDSSPLMNEEGELVGSMNADSFVENPGEQINTSQEVTLTLYFSDDSGTRLVKKTRVVHYSTNISLEKLVMEQLIYGPNGSDVKATVPSVSRLINISVADGICYVSLDDNFKNNLNNQITEQVILYSIVDSLASLPEVDKVQISINGDTSGKLMYNYDLAVMYELDESLVAGEEAQETVADTEEVQENQ